MMDKSIMYFIFIYFVGSNLVTCIATRPEEECKAYGNSILKRTYFLQLMCITSVSK